MRRSQAGNYEYCECTTVLCRTAVHLSSVMGGGSEVFVGNLVCSFKELPPMQYWGGQLFCKAQYKVI